MPILRSIALTAVIVSAFAAFPAFAVDDPAHPAYHFEPTIIIKVPDAASASNASVAPAPTTAASAPTPQDAEKYPGAYFTPRVIYP